MSRKYQRVKQQDLLLPAPLRWLTRAFSSITMAVILLTLVSLYAVLATIPLGLLLRFGGYGLIVLIACGVPGYLGYRLIRHRGWFCKIGGLLVIHLGMPLAGFGCRHWSAMLEQSSFHQAYQRVLFYRLPGIDMTEMQFYGAWPMQLLLGLFVLNMVWATIRRIEFHWLNLGVLSVHGGIVLIAGGSVIYSAFKVEGDALLWRDDLGGQPVGEFYDKSEPAIHFTLPDKTFFVPVPRLPRYNDYAWGELDIALHDDPYFRKAFGPQFKATIPAFIADGQLHPTWVQADAATAEPDLQGTYPDGYFALTQRDVMQLGMSVSGNAADAKPVGPMLLGHVPARRVMENSLMGIEYLVAPSPTRLADLQAEFSGEHGLIVEIPALGHRSVHAISVGQRIELPGTGYRLEIGQIGPYGIAFVTPGYEGATDRRAMVKIIKPDGSAITRLVMDRYPERSQDFSPLPDQASDPAAEANSPMGLLGRRSDPDPAIRLVYLDASRTQLHLVALSEKKGERTLHLLSRPSGGSATCTTVNDGRFALSDAHGQRQVWFHVLQRYDSAQTVLRPQPTDWQQRNPKQEGTFLNALVPLVLQWPVDGGTKTTILWLPFMRYPMWPDEEHFPIQVSLPDGRPLQIAFSRSRLSLPFRMRLKEFTMTPYPGTEIPRDFASVLELADRDRQSEPVVGRSHLNNPLVYRGYKISQSGWDPGDAADPARNEKSADGRFLNQQRYTILGIGNNIAIQAVFVGSLLLVLGIPWAFYVKPAIQQKRKQRWQTLVSAGEPTAIGKEPS